MDTNKPRLSSTLAYRRPDRVSGADIIKSILSDGVNTASGPPIRRMIDTMSPGIMMSKTKITQKYDVKDKKHE